MKAVEFDQMTALLKGERAYGDVAGPRFTGGQRRPTYRPVTFSSSLGRTRSAISREEVSRDDG
jgi:hypothetical protein